MKPLLTICPTFNRPDMLKDMLASFKDTSTGDIVFGVSINDPQFHETLKIVRDYEYRIFDKDKTITQILNELCQEYPDYEYYHITNDDVIYQTKEWDERIISLNKAVVFYGNDLFQGINLPTMPIIHRDLIKTVGWLQMPTLNRYCGDLVWRFLTQKICLYYFPDIIIEHKHFLAGKGNTPVNMDTYKKDMQSFAKWVAGESELQIMKVRELCKSAFSPLP